MDSAARWRDLLDVVKRLTAVMARENELLAQFRGDLIGPLQDEKSTLAATYLDMAKAFKRDPASYRLGEPGPRAAATAIIRRFKEVAALNERALFAARQASDHVVKAIIDSAKEQRSQPGYGALNRRLNPTRADHARPISVALDGRF